MKNFVGGVVVLVASGVLGCGSGASTGESVAAADQTLPAGSVTDTVTTRVSCASQLFQRRECDVDTQGGHIVDARITQDMSNPPYLCNQGNSHGFTPNTVWVNHGCSAEFEVQIEIPQPVETREQIRCTSDNGRYTSCSSSLTNIRDAHLVRQESSAPCQQGTSWGFYSDAVWVDRGCRGVFEVVGRPGGPPPPPSYGVELYEQRNAQGAFYAVNGTLPNLADVGFNDRAQSIIVRGGNWEFCQNANFNGFCQTFGPGEYDNLGPLAGQISSVRPQ